MYDLRFNPSLFDAGNLPDDPDLAKNGIYAAFAIVENSENILLYIGKAEKETFAERIPAHIPADHRAWLKRALLSDAPIYYRIAPVADKTIIDDLESILIYYHAPYGNTQKVRKYLGPRPVPTITSNLSRLSVPHDHPIFEIVHARNFTYHRHDLP